MKATLRLTLAVLLLAPLAAAAEEPMHQTKPSPALERFRALAGEWTNAEAGGPAFTVTYRVTSAGSAVVETLFPGTPDEMTSIYTQDGEDLLLTHYCALGNQPRMRAKATGGEAVEFAFDGGTNFDPARDLHMHQMRMVFLGPDEISGEWTSFTGSQPGGTVKFHVRRKS